MLRIEQRNLANFQKNLMTRKPTDMHISNHFGKKRSQLAKCSQKRKTQLGV
jgi:hypothetical protein